MNKNANYPKNEWNHENLEDILTSEQEKMLQAWLKLNGLKYLEYDDSFTYGVSVFAEDKTNDVWQIDFMREKPREINQEID